MVDDPLCWNCVACWPPLVVSDDCCSGVFGGTLDRFWSLPEVHCEAGCVSLVSLQNAHFCPLSHREIVALNGGGEGSDWGVLGK